MQPHLFSWSTDKSQMTHNNGSDTPSRDLYPRDCCPNIPGESNLDHMDTYHMVCQDASEIEPKAKQTQHQIHNTDEIRTGNVRLRGYLCLCRHNITQCATDAGQTGLPCWASDPDIDQTLVLCWSSVREAGSTQNQCLEPCVRSCPLLKGLGLQTATIANHLQYTSTS